MTVHLMVLAGLIYLGKISDCRVADGPSSLDPGVRVQLARPCKPIAFFSYLEEHETDNLIISYNLWDLT